MRLKWVEIDNFRAIGHLKLDLDPEKSGEPRLTVLHADNANGKTSVLSAIAVGLDIFSPLLDSKTGFSLKSTDRRHGVLSVSVKLTSADGFSWSHSVESDKAGEAQFKDNLDEILSEVPYFINRKNSPLPILAYYGTDRSVLDINHSLDEYPIEYRRTDANFKSLSAKINFASVIEWFYAKENEELREQRSRQDFGYHHKELDAVRRAISATIPGAANPHIDVNPLRFVVSLRTGEGREETLALDELSGGYRIMLALVADLARRMAQGNPHLEDPLESEAIVLIDEVDLHLHPFWQQRVLEDLMRTFPKTQFIVSTHSPQVLSTVKPEHIVHLTRRDGEIIAEPLFLHHLPEFFPRGGRTGAGRAATGLDLISGGRGGG